MTRQRLGGLPIAGCLARKQPAWPAMLALLLMAGCGVFGLGGRTPREECEWQANKDPTVLDLEVKRFSVTPSEPDINPDIAVARHEAVVRCLQARGLMPPGGVQPVRPRF